MSSNEASKTTEAKDLVSEQVIQETEESPLASESPVVSASSNESVDNLQAEPEVSHSSKLNFSIPMLVSLALIITAIIDWNS